LRGDAAWLIKSLGKYARLDAGLAIADALAPLARNWPPGQLR
jgi:hypothetical protein